MFLTRSILAPVLALTAALCPVPAAAQAPESVRESSYVAPGGMRVLQHVVVIPATLQQAWDAFTTTEGAAAWVAPVVKLDFRLGGIWEASYRPDAKIGDPGNIKNRFVSFRPPHMVSIQVAETPPGLAHAERLKQDIVTVIEFKELGPKQVEVTESMSGFMQGDAAHDAIYDFFRKGNVMSLTALRKRFVDGPIDFRAR